MYIKKILSVVFVGGVVCGIVCKIKDSHKTDKYDSEGYNEEGYDKLGYDRDGFNKEGYDKLGYDRDGFNKKGYNEQGYDCNGIDRDGYDENGFNVYGVDRVGKNIDSYKIELRNLRERLTKAQDNLKCKEINYVATDVRLVMETVLKMMFRHYGYKCDEKKENYILIEECYKRKLLNKELCTELHVVRRICNFELHEINDYDEKCDYKKWDWAIKTVYDLTDEAEKRLVN